MHTNVLIIEYPISILLLIIESVRYMKLLLFYWILHDIHTSKYTIRSHTYAWLRDIVHQGINLGKAFFQTSLLHLYCKHYDIYGFTLYIFVIKK